MTLELIVKTMEIYLALMALVISIPILMIYRRYIIYSLALVYCFPILMIMPLLLFVYQTFSWFTRRQLRRGRVIPTIKVVTRVTYWLYVILEVFEAEFIKTVQFLGGKEMAITIQRPGATETYIPKCQDPEDPGRAEFYFQKARASKRARVRDEMVEFGRDGDFKVKSQVTALKLLESSLIGWKGILDENGQPQQFDPQDVLGSFDLLPTEIQDELLARFTPAGEAGAGAQDEEDD